MLVRNASVGSPERAAKVIRRLCSLRPQLAIVLGSGFRTALKRLQVLGRVSFAAVPGFPVPGVLGHAGEVLVGSIGQQPIIVLNGRSHYYEGYALQQVTFPIRVLHALGVRDVVFTNAAGGIHKTFKPGDLMVIEDHINFMGENPLRGFRGNPAERFVDLTSAYDPELRALLLRAAKAEGIRLRKGIYLAVSGSNYETPAEIRAFGQLGADAVGMSTVPEVIVARQCGIRVAGLSCITNLAAGLSGGPLSHAEVLATASAAEAQAGRVLTQFVNFLPRDLR
jgi:purine-nucleoside phosphorylase